MSLEPTQSPAEVGFVLSGVVVAVPLKDWAIALIVAVLVTVVLAVLTSWLWMG